MLCSYQGGYTKILWSSSWRRGKETLASVINRSRMDLITGLN